MTMSLPELITSWRDQAAHLTTQARASQANGMLTSYERQQAKAEQLTACADGLAAILQAFSQDWPDAD